MNTRVPDGFRGLHPPFHADGGWALPTGGPAGTRMTKGHGMKGSGMLVGGQWRSATRTGETEDVTSPPHGAGGGTPPGGGGGGGGAAVTPARPRRGGGGGDPPPPRPRPPP